MASNIGSDGINDNEDINLGNGCLNRKTRSISQDFGTNFKTFTMRQPRELDVDCQIRSGKQFVPKIDAALRSTAILSVAERRLE